MKNDQSLNMKNDQLFLCDGANICKNIDCRGRVPHRHKCGRPLEPHHCNEERDCSHAKKFTVCQPYYSFKIELDRDLFKI
jgi:hypothetical protein